MDAQSSVISAAAQVPPAWTNDELIIRAFAASRTSLRWVLCRLGFLEEMIKNVDQLGATAKIDAAAAVRATYSRDIAVLSDKLRINGGPWSSEFRSASQKALLLIRRNLYENGLIVDEGTSGRCDPKCWGGGIPFAAATPWDPEPRVSICAAWFQMNEYLQRDVITHEFFHLVGLIDRSVIAHTGDALDDANTMAQLVACLHDRSRWEDSSGLSKPAVIYPAP
jgi:hypothetical protein